MDGIKRTQGIHNPSSVNHQTMQKSSTLNRRYVKRPVARPKISSTAMREAENLERRQALASQVGREQLQVPVRIQQSVQGGASEAKRSADNNVASDDMSAEVQQQRLAEEYRRLEEQRQQVLRQQRALTQQQRKIAQQEQKQKVGFANEAGRRSNQIVEIANARLAARNAAEPRHLTSQELKDRAIRQALERVATMDNQEQVDEVEARLEKATKRKHFWQRKKLVLAAAMSVVSILVLGYLVKVNLPDLSVKVAAMQTGIDGSYPSYLPKDYSLDGLVSEKDGRITMSFVGKDGRAFTLTEEKSSWDSSAVLANFVLPNWGNDYVTVKGQGLTIYVFGSNATWVNGGILYKIIDETNTLTKQQLHDIAVGL